MSPFLAALVVMLTVVAAPAGEAVDTAPPATASHPQEAPPPEEGYDILSQIFSFLYTIAHGIGQLVVKAIQWIIPEAGEVLETLIDPIGVLALLTIFLGVYEVAKRITWLIVVIGWALIVIKIVLVVLKAT